MDKPVRILGAGPAGLTAAITLARRGIRAEVFERQPDCGSRFHGDLQGIENFSTRTEFRDELAAIGIEPDFLLVPFHYVTGVSPDLRQYRISGKSILYHIAQRGTMRGSIDQSLKAQALAAGVVIHFGQNAEEEDMDIVAGGAPPDQIRAICYGETFETDHSDAAYVMLDNRFAYRGYSYLLIASGHGCLCSGVFGRFPEIKQQFAAAKARFHEFVSFTMRDVVQVGGYGTFRGRPRFTEGKRFYAGEAAGLQDPLFMFGLRYAIQSGHLAARGFLGEIDYQKEAHQRFSPRVRAGIVNRTLWEIQGNAGYHQFLKFAVRQDGREFFWRLSHASLAHDLAFPIARRILNT